jgi:acyl-CoA dehydrogenase
MDFLDAPPLPFYFSPDHEQFRASVRDFISREITPHVNAWDEAETFPRSLYARAAELGILGLGYPEEYAARRPTCSISSWWPRSSRAAARAACRPR